MPRIVVERSFDTPLSAEGRKAMEARLQPLLAASGIRLLRTLWSADRKRMISEYEAADAGVVRDAQREGGAKFDRVWAAEAVDDP